MSQRRMSPPRRTNEADKELIEQIMKEEEEERIEKENKLKEAAEAREVEIQEARKQKEAELRQKYYKNTEKKLKAQLKKLKAYYEKKYQQRVEKSTKEMNKIEKITVLATEEALYARYNYNIEGMQMQKTQYSVFNRAKKGKESIMVKITNLKKGPKYYKKCLVEEDSYKPIGWLIKNPNVYVIKCYDTFIVGDKYYFFQEPLVMNLESYLKTGGRAEEEKAREIMRDVGEGLLYLHSNGIAHRDLCARNVLLDRTAKTIKIGGVQCAVPFWNLERKEPRIFGTLHEKDAKYISPEERDGDHDASKADIWGLGATAIYAMSKQYPPHTEFEVFQSNKLSHASEDFIDLMKKTLAKPKDRPTATEFLSHAWFKVYVTLAK